MRPIHKCERENEQPVIKFAPSELHVILVYLPFDPGGDFGCSTHSDRTRMGMRTGSRGLVPKLTVPRDPDETGSSSVSLSKEVCLNC